jgi:2-hydroxy-3-oxopropionate reductase
MIEPVLKIFGKVFHVGERPGLGQAMKLANNYLSATALAATSEAMVFGVKAGLDPDLMIDVLNSGSGRNSATQDKFPRSILPGTFDFGFTTGLMYKDLKLFTEEAEAAGTSLWIASIVRQVWQHANGQIGGDADFTTVIKPLEQWAGVQVRSHKRGTNS